MRFSDLKLGQKFWFSGNDETPCVKESCTSYRWYDGDDQMWETAKVKPFTATQMYVKTEDQWEWGTHEEEEAPWDEEEPPEDEV